MILVYILILTIAGALACLGCGRRGMTAKVIAAAVLGADLAITVVYAGLNHQELSGGFLTEVRAQWIAVWGAEFYLAADGLGLIFLILTFFIGLAALAADHETYSGTFYFNYLLVIAALIGVFTAMDLLLFYLSWEGMLIPMYFIIRNWGVGANDKAAMKFLLYSQGSSLLMLAGIIGLYIMHGAATSQYSFNLSLLLDTARASDIGWLFLAGFILAFGVKMAVFGVHTWQPDAYTFSPAAGTIVLSALLSKAGAYGLLRFGVGIFPVQMTWAGPVLITIAVIGILYGAILAFAQTDIKRFIAYTSISHMSFVLLGISCLNQYGFYGAIILMLGHSFSITGLFIIAGEIEHRTGSREIRVLGGLWSASAKTGGLALVFMLGAMGLPGLAGFTGEFMILLGTYVVSPAGAIFAAMGMIASVIYATWFVCRIFFGNREPAAFPLRPAMLRTAICGLLVVLLVLFGLFPKPVIKAVSGTRTMIGADQSSREPARGSEESR